MWGAADTRKPKPQYPRPVRASVPSTSCSGVLTPFQHRGIGTACAENDLSIGKSLRVFLKPRNIGGNSGGSELLLSLGGARLSRQIKKSKHEKLIQIHRIADSIRMNRPHAIVNIWDLILR